MQGYNENKLLRQLSLICLTLVLLATNWKNSHAAPSDIERVSIDSTGNQGKNANQNESPSISGDGRFIAFYSEFSNLVDGDTNDVSDIFVYDQQKKATTRVSVNSNGSQGLGYSFYPSISYDGRFVTFQSFSFNLVDSDYNSSVDIFMHDQLTGSTTRLSVNSNGIEGNNHSFRPKISADSRFITFSSDASNLVNNDTNNSSDIFVHDRLLSNTIRISVDSNGNQGNGDSYLSSISSDGRFIAFESKASNLVNNDTNNVSDIFVHDLQTGTTTRVSANQNGDQGNGSSEHPDISDDGRFVTFSSNANNLVSNDGNNRADIFVHDRQTGITTRVSVNNSGSQGNDYSEHPAISGNGRFITFSSWAYNLVDNDSQYSNDIFVHDQQTGTTTRVSISGNGEQGNSYNESPSISDDGRFVTFSSEASNLVSNDNNNTEDIFIHDQQTGTTTQASVGESGGNGESHLPSISSDGRFVTFYSYASNLVSHDTNAAGDIFVHDRQTKTTTRASVSSNGDEGNDLSADARISSNGRFVTFRSWASNLVNNDSNGFIDIFVHDQQTGTTTRASVSSSGTQGNGDSERPDISSDGRYIAFASSASNLVNNDSNNVSDIFVHDQQTGATTRVSVSSSGSQGNNSSSFPSISSDGRFVTFVSDASTLVSGDTNNASDIFVHDRQTGATSRISTNSSSSQSNDDSNYPSISSNGRFVVFHSIASNLVYNDTNDVQDIFVHDRQTGTTTRVSINSNGNQVNGSSWAPSISSDGRFISFDSISNNLVNEDNNNTWDAFVHDQETGTTIRASVNSSGSEGNANSEYTSISGNGRFVAFRSHATNLVNGDSNGVADIFVAELEGSITSVYLPLMLKNHINYFEGPQEREDNDTATQANGPLRPNQTYLGYPNDEKDYFFIHLSQPGHIIVDLQNYTATGQLQLFYQNTDTRVALATAPPYHLDYEGAAGTYYIYIATTTGFNTTTPYILKVDY